MRIWSIQERRQEAVLKGFTASVNCAAISNDNKYIIAASDDKTLRIWNFQDRREECVLQGYNYSMRIIEITRDKRYVISGCDKTFRIWNFAQRRQICVLEMQMKKSVSFAFSENNKYFVTCSRDQSIRVLKVIL